MNIIKQKRIEKGISVEDMAVIFNLDIKEYKKFEDDINTMKWDLYIIILKFLDIK